MALAASADAAAAGRLRNVRRDSRTQELPSAPVWLLIPSTALKKSENLPAGTRMFARTIADADRVTVAIAPQGRQFEAKLEAGCRSEGEASTLVTQLERTTSLLQEMIARENQKPNPADLSGVLTAGVFHREGRRVIGRWPLERAFLENLTGAAP